MPIINRVADFHSEITGWRRELHQIPEISFDVPKTAARVADLLKSFGVDEVVTGMAKNGVVGVIKGRGPGKTIGLRSDMDALPINERTGKPYASQTPGKMHACGHDGHMAMLLGAAKYLAETRNFDGTAVVIFQPAEEGDEGGRVMVEEGLMERFGIEEVYGMHNMPDLAAGSFQIRAGGFMASSDYFTIEIEGAGGHAAKPHKGVDPVLIAAQTITALQSIASRNVNPLRSAVVSVTMIKAGDAFNVIPQKVTLTGTARALDEAVRGTIESRISEIARGIAGAMGGTADVYYRRGCPVTTNTVRETAFAASIARGVSGGDRVEDNADASMGAEDFSFMLQARPGAMIFLGNGPTAGLHADTYDFNDEIIPTGVSYWVKLMEGASAAE
ncbi:MAG TPA: M20 aminoacylase family protein [Devosia sp.]|nr:M20 aminoacylase family protein [Devosia sp.]